MNLSDIKHCPTCDKDLPIDSFGFCRARRDGRNLYCKNCVNKKTAEGRRNLKEYNAAKKRYMVQQAAILSAMQAEEAFDSESVSKLSPVERVRNAIRDGYRTQKAIRRETKLAEDVIGDALVVLILDNGEVVSESDGKDRYYFMREEKEQPERKDCVLSLHCLGPVIRHECVKEVA